MPASPRLNLERVADGWARASWRLWFLQCVRARGLTSPCVSVSSGDYLTRSIASRALLAQRIREHTSLVPLLRMKLELALSSSPDGPTVARSSLHDFLSSVDSRYRTSLERKLELLAIGRRDTPRPGPRPPHGESWVIDLTRRRIPPPLRRLLSRGLDFVPTPSPRDECWMNAIADIDHALNRAESHARKSAERHLADPSNSPPLLFTPSDVSSVRAIIASQLCSYKPRTAPNMPADEAAALQFLRDDHTLVVVPADKGGAVVVLDAVDYVAAARSTLDHPAVGLTPEDVLTTELQEVRDSVSTLTPDLRPILFPDPASRLSYAYVLPKVHKLPPGPRDHTTVLSLKWRPVVSAIATPTCNIQRFLSHLLLNTVYADHAPEHIANAEQLLESNTSVSAGHRLVSFDVVNMFGSVPIGPAIDLVISLWCEKYISASGISPTQLHELLRLCTCPTYVHPDGSLRRQTVGLPMGGPISPVLCMLYVAWIIKRACLPSEWLFRYVDDTLASVPVAVDAASLVSSLEVADPEGVVKWSFELSSSAHSPSLPCDPIPPGTLALPFLDLLLPDVPGPLNPRPYSKPCSVTRVADAASGVAPAHHRAWAMSLLHTYTRRYVRPPTGPPPTPLVPVAPLTCYGDPPELSAGRRALGVVALTPVIRSRASRAGYSSRWVSSVLDDFMHPRPKEPHEPIWVTLPPWFPVPHIRRALSTVGVDVSTTGRPWSIGAFVNSRRRAPHVGGAVVYAYRCHSCSVVYVGETTRPAERHVAHASLDSRVGQHVVDFPSHVFDTPVILASAAREHCRLFLESVYGNAVPRARSLNHPDVPPDSTMHERRRMGALLRIPAEWYTVLHARGFVKRAYERLRRKFGELPPPPPRVPTYLSGPPPISTWEAIAPRVASPSPRIPVPRVILASPPHVTSVRDCHVCRARPLDCQHRLRVPCCMPACESWLCDVCAGGLVRLFTCGAHRPDGAIVTDGDPPYLSQCFECGSLVRPAADVLMCEDDDCVRLVCRVCRPHVRLQVPGKRRRSPVRVSAPTEWRCASHALREPVFARSTSDCRGPSDAPPDSIVLRDVAVSATPTPDVAAATRCLSPHHTKLWCHPARLLTRITSPLPNRGCPHGMCRMCCFAESLYGPLSFPSTPHSCPFHMRPSQRFRAAMPGPPHGDPRLLPSSPLPPPRLGRCLPRQCPQPAPYPLRAPPATPSCRPVRVLPPVPSPPAPHSPRPLMVVPWSRHTEAPPLLTWSDSPPPPPHPLPTHPPPEPAALVVDGLAPSLPLSPLPLVSPSPPSGLQLIGPPPSSCLSPCTRVLPPSVPVTPAAGGCCRPPDPPPDPASPLDIALSATPAPARAVVTHCLSPHHSRLWRHPARFLTRITSPSPARGCVHGMCRMCCYAEALYGPLSPSNAPHSCPFHMRPSLRFRAAMPAPHCCDPRLPAPPPHGVLMRAPPPSPAPLPRPPSPSSPPRAALVLPLAPATPTRPAVSGRPLPPVTTPPAAFVLPLTSVTRPRPSCALPAPALPSPVPTVAPLLRCRHPPPLPCLRRPGPPTPAPLCSPLQRVRYSPLSPPAPGVACVAVRPSAPAAHSRVVCKRARPVWGRSVPTDTPSRPAVVLASRSPLLKRRARAVSPQPHVFHVVGDLSTVCRAAFAPLPPQLRRGRVTDAHRKIVCACSSHSAWWATGVRARLHFSVSHPGRCPHRMCRFCCNVTAINGGVSARHQPCPVHGLPSRSLLAAWRHGGRA